MGRDREDGRIPPPARRRTRGGLLCLAVLAFGLLPARGEGRSAEEAAPAAPAPATDLSGAYAFPVPFKPSLGHTRITFTNLSSEATIKIYTSGGVLIRTLLETDQDGLLRWDGTDEDGQPAGSDLYLYVIENAQQTKVGKLLIVR